MKNIGLFKLGQRVWSINHGDGTVVDVACNRVDITVEFDENYLEVHFNNDTGTECLSKTGIQTLFHEKVNVTTRTNQSYMIGKTYLVSGEQTNNSIRFIRVNDIIQAYEFNRVHASILSLNGNPQTWGIYTLDPSINTFLEVEIKK